VKEGVSTQCLGVTGALMALYPRSCRKHGEEDEEGGGHEQLGIHVHVVVVRVVIEDLQD